MLSMQRDSARGSMQSDVKKHLVALMLSSEAAVRKQLSEALAIIAKADFPHLWPTLLPELVQQLQQGTEAVKVRLRLF